MEHLSQSSCQSPRESSSESSAIPLENPPTLSAEEVHGILVQSYRLGNRLRRKFLEALLLLSETKLYLMLGYSSVFQYAEKHFDYHRSYTYEALRAAKALGELPRTLEAFDQGNLSYSRALEITRVATTETEEEWLLFSYSKTFAELKAEVKDAVDKSRKRPRKDAYGLPGVKSKITFELSPTEHDLAQKGIAKTIDELSRSLGGKTIDPKTAVLFLLQRALETDPAEMPKDRVEKDHSIYTILYHTCPTCRASHLATDEGLVQVPSAVLERVEGEAETVRIEPKEEIQSEHCCKGSCDNENEGGAEREIDHPNTPALTRRILLRDREVCSNPMCGRKLGLHCHHIVLRSEGGRTAFFNEIAVCPLCHALCHLDLLSVEGDPLTGLKWRTKTDGIQLDLKLEKEDLSALPKIASLSRALDKPEEMPKEAAPKIDKDHLDEYQDVCLALLKLGFSKEEGKIAAERTLEEFLKAGRKAPVQEVILEAVRRFA
jgi:hypothetical protein